MKTKKLAYAKGTGIVKVSREVAEFERESQRLRAAFQRVSKLQESPAVQAHLAALAAKKQTDEAEAPPKEAIQLYDAFSRHQRFVSDQLWILSELSFAPHDCDIPLQNLHSTIVEIDSRMNALGESAKRAFALLGIGQAESAPAEEKAA